MKKKQENEKDMPYPNNNVNHVSNFPHLFSMRKNLNLHYDINPQTSISKRKKTKKKVKLLLLPACLHI